MQKGFGVNRIGIILFAVLGSFLNPFSGNSFFSTAFADQSVIRWTGSEDPNGSIENVLNILSQKLGYPLKKADFALEEDRDLAFNHYQRWAQVADHLPIYGKSIRIWTELNSNKAVQVEAKLESVQRMALGLLTLSSLNTSAEELRNDLSSEKTLALARQSVQSYSDDPYLQGIGWRDQWNDGELYRVVKVRGKRGNHSIWISLRTQKVTNREYTEFPQWDFLGRVGTKPRVRTGRPVTRVVGPCPTTGCGEEISIPAQVYPIYEEVEGKGDLLPRIPAELKYIQRNIYKVEGDIYAPLKSRRYFDYKYDPILGETEEGRKNGYWAMSYLKRQAEEIRSALPLVANDFSTGVVLQGRYATINIHPDAVEKFKPLNFSPRSSSRLFPNWVPVMNEGRPGEELIPSTAYTGKPIFSGEEVWVRPATRLPDHDPIQYINDGFDEVQVYYAINTLFDALRARGFLDPDLSTRPLNAFLFNPDIAYRDNAFYTDDTINFTTYSPKAGNAARDNGTIWHELGHGVMDRLMGERMELADTGGLSEGMADFVAALVVQAVTDGVPFPGSDEFRIINKTAFFMTNEVHDDGEAYGGAMKDFLDAVIKEKGKQGLAQVTDVVLEAMRLTRDYPGLTAKDWFEHLLFADSLGREGVRAPGELKPFVLATLAGRNFDLDGGEGAAFSLQNAATHREITSRGPGSRNAPITVRIPKDGTANFALEASLRSSKNFAFQYPIDIKVMYKGGPLEGAIHWVGEENGPQTFVLNSESDKASIPLQITGTCDEINRADGTCVDYVYVQVLKHGEAKPIAKKRFYLRVQNPS